MKARDAMKLYNVTYNTIRAWAKNGIIKSEVLPSGQINYIPTKPTEDLTRKNVIYARVSTSSQSENLKRQVERLKLFCSASGIKVNDTYEEIASALNYNRRMYLKLLNEIIDKQIDTIIIEYKDRLLRIGFDEFKHICDKFNTKIIVIDESNTDKTYTQEITDDLIAIIHHYSMRLYSSRKRKKIENILKNDHTENKV
jgi:predicted site-specific integrase-resolvase